MTRLLPIEVRRYDTKTRDRWTLALHRYRLPTAKTPKRLPVVLCHGLASNRFSFDAPDGPSLARFLAERGYDVWALDLRGAGSSAKPHIVTSLRWEWSFRHYLEYDAPAGLDLVRGATGASEVHWVGHSLGGMLAYALMVEGALAGQPPPFASVTTMASPTVHVGPAPNIPGAKMVQALLTRLQNARTPFAFSARLGVPLTGALYRLALFRILYNPDNMDPATVRRLLPHALDDVPARLLLDYLTAFEARREGRGVPLAFAYEARLDLIDKPLLVMGGPVDGLCPLPALTAVYDRASSPIKLLRVLSRANGCRHDYGHHDILFGHHVEAEVFAPIAQWLDARDVALTETDAVNALHPQRRDS